MCPTSVICFHCFKFGFYLSLFTLLASVRPVWIYERGVPWGDAGAVSSVFCPSIPRWLALTPGRVLAPRVLKACAGASALSIDLLVRPCLIPSV